MADSVLDASRIAFEAFLVEDVILTLGNIRGSLGWLGAGASVDRICIERLDRQLELLEDRARRMASALSAEASASEPANLFAAPETSEDGLPHVPALAGARVAIADTVGGHLTSRSATVFRSRRA